MIDDDEKMLAYTGLNMMTIVEHAYLLISTNMDVKCPNCDRVTLIESVNHMCDDVPVVWISVLLKNTKKQMRNLRIDWRKLKKYLWKYLKKCRMSNPHKSSSHAFIIVM